MNSTVKVAIADEFLEAMMNLPKQQQKKVIQFVSKFRSDPRQTGINYERINNAINSGYRSVRIDQAYRGIVLAPDLGNVFVLLWVDKHDDAYRWAETKECAIHPETGTLQIYESETAAKDQQAAAKPEAISPAFFDLLAKECRQIGVPDNLVDGVLSVTNEEQLLDLEKKLPTEAFEALYLLAAETPKEQILTEYGAPVGQMVDTADIEAALERPATKRSFAVVDDDEALQAILEAPLEKWRVFLHPTQRKLVERDWNGPVRVLGGAGTGKTVVALHRAKWLAGNVASDGERILLTTFTSNLAKDISENLAKICTGTEFDRIEVLHIDKWIHGYLKRQNYERTIVYERMKPFEDAWKTAITVKESELGLADSFYREELRRVILPQRIRSRVEYFRADRKGRGTALTRRQRAAIWPVFEEFRSRLRRSGLTTIEDATLDAIDLLNESKSKRPFRCVVVDETQDMGPEVLSLVRALSPEQKNDLFLVGDGHQRIYRKRCALSHCGINIMGRGRKLKINYRTTEETRQFSLTVLENASFDDLDGGSDPAKHCRSLMHGERPVVRSFDDMPQELGWIASEIKTLIQSGAQDNEICVCARTSGLVNQIGEALLSASLEVRKLSRTVGDDRTKPGVRIATMHRIKGLEFQYMFVAGCTDGTIPLSSIINDTDDEVEKRDCDLNERALFHVAATRAIKKLYVTGAKPISPYVK